jgi:hypothetical protein
LAQFAKIVEAGPDREKNGIVRWRRVDLKRVIAERFGVDFHPRYVGKLLKKLSFSHISARPRHPAQDERIVEGFKKNFPRALKAHLAGLPETTPIEIWFQMLCGRDLCQTGKPHIWNRSAVDSDVRCNPVDSIGPSTESRVSHSEPRLLLGFQGTKAARREGKVEPVQ